MLNNDIIERSVTNLTYQNCDFGRVRQVHKFCEQKRKKRMITAYHAKYFSHDLTGRHASNSVDRISVSLFDASVDLNPHQIEAALFSMNNPLSKGVILADEVGLGKTIEAALVLCQLWTERKRNLLVICPASLRKQWATELKEKFNLPTQILDTVTYKRLQKKGQYAPLKNDRITIVSYQFPIRREEQFIAVPWDLVVIDEAHKLRNAHRKSNKTGQAIRQIFDNRQKILLTATPLQNSLMELYGLSSVIDEHLFGDEKSFRKQFMGGEASLRELRERLVPFVKRTLRKQVSEYIQYTERKTITIPFTPTDQEHLLYTEVSDFLSREDTYALPSQQRHLTSLVARKLLASSPHAIINTLKTIKSRLESIKNETSEMDDEDFLEALLEDDDIKTDYLEEDDAELVEETYPVKKIERLDEEIATLDKFIADAGAISNDTKAKALLEAIRTGFERMASMTNNNNEKAPRKAIVFTESKRTQKYLADYLSQNGYQDKIITFSGSNDGPKATKVYQDWLKQNKGSDKVTGSAQVDRRAALMDYFRDEAEIFIATEAASEGVNLQFCALLINYDLPWNPQRIEQRIGRCHRYGQKFDVVVINFLNKRNQADQRVLELLTEKFKLFDGVFGTSDEVLGSVESGIDFEKTIARIYDTCRTPEEIERAFGELQKNLESYINEKIKQAQQALIEHFDEDIHDLLKIKLDEAESRLDKVGRYFWRVTKYMLSGEASFDDENYVFRLSKSSKINFEPGIYQLVRRGRAKTLAHAHKYRLTHPLGEQVLADAKEQDTPPAEIVFHYSNYESKISVIEKLIGKSGWMLLRKLRVESLQIQEYLLFTGMMDDGSTVDQETCEKLFACDAMKTPVPIDKDTPDTLKQNAQRQLDAKISSLVEENNQFFQAERDKLEKWADDKILGAEQALDDTKKHLRSLKREARMSTTIEEQQQNQTKIRDLEKLQRRQRQEIFEVEDQIMEKRDRLINALEEKLLQTIGVDELFVLRWKII